MFPHLDFPRLSCGLNINNVLYIKGIHQQLFFFNNHATGSYSNALHSPPAGMIQRGDFVEGSAALHLENTYPLRRIFLTLSVSHHDYILFCSRYLYHSSTYFYTASFMV